MTISEYLSARAATVEQALDEVLPTADSQPGVLHEAVRYSSLGGGKRLRAIMAMAACRAVGGEENDALGFALVLEMIHAYSLIHDDLPAMDDDDVRRGKPSNHKVYGEGLAILAGDALLTKAFEQLAMLPEKYPVTLISAYRLLLAAAKAAGSRGMVGGQALDLVAEGQPVDKSTLETIHRKKTGALFELALHGGGIIGGASDRELTALLRYAEHFGLAFQIVDDILDVIGDESVLGKKTGADQLREKATYVSLYGLEEAKTMALACGSQCQKALEHLSGDVWALQELAHYVIDRRW